jgi:hypothetical protein
MIVLDENKHVIAITAPGPQGPQGAQGPQAPNVMLQYSEGGTTWHDVATINDNYFRFSTDGGVTWSEPLWFCSTAEAKSYMEDAQAAEIKAEQWAENPEDIEVVAGQYSALHHKEKAIDAQIAAEAAQSAAATSEANAAVSESNAATSATNAATSETNALASENKAHKWAEEDEDVEVETGEYSAYHWAQKAASFAPLIEDQIVDGVTTKTASQNAIYDALVMLERKVGGGILI